VRIGALAALAVACLVAAGIAAADTRGTASSRGAQAASASGCKLGNDEGQIKHVINIVFDNTHLFRDRPQFASDLELMPHLLSFLQGNGTLSDNEHTILISHTAGGILSSLTGLYPDRMGQAVTNSYRYFKADGTTASSTSFKYWNDLVDDVNGTADSTPNMVNGDSGTPKTAPAPWVPYTRAGCDFGAVATANVVLENTGTGKFGDMTTVFGSGSPEWNEAVTSNSAPPGTKERALAQTDFVGLAVHCAKGGGICAGSPNAKADNLPDEEGGYTGFKGLFGAKYVNPAITHGQPVVNDTSGQPINDPFGQPGFPGFDGMSAATTLGYVAQMQEAGIPVTFAYISDAHDNHHDPSGRNVAYGPGEAGYVQQLQQYDQAFATFFDRLAKDGITTKNTLFLVTADENDHFAGGDSPDGTWSHTNCDISHGQTCPANQIGEVNANLTALLPAGEPAFTVHSDSAPTVYVTGNPGRTDPAVRKLERDVAAAKAIDPYIDPAPQPITLWLADTVEEKTLHMVTADPQRTPTFTLFALPDYFISTFNCAADAGGGPVCIDYHFAWSHGDATDDIGRTWLGLAGPGVRNLGRTSQIWSDHADIRPTILSLLGLKDTYEQDGRVLGEALKVGESSKTLTQLGVVYKQVTAPFGAFAKDTLVASTKALASGDSTDDSTYTSLEGKIESLTAERDGVAGQMRSALNAAAFGGTAPSDKQLKSLIAMGNDLLARAHALASS
jgi:hypothetical protein